MTPFIDPSTVNCPQCSASNPLEIVYGLPSDEMRDAAHTGSISLGGCIVQNDSPAYQCRECGNSFGTLPA